MHDDDPAYAFMTTRILRSMPPAWNSSLRQPTNDEAALHGKRDITFNTGSGVSIFPIFPAAAILLFTFCFLNGWLRRRRMRMRGEFPVPSTPPWPSGPMGMEWLQELLSPPPPRPLLWDVRAAKSYGYGGHSWRWREIMVS